MPVFAFERFCLRVPVRVCGDESHHEEMARAERLLPISAERTNTKQIKHSVLKRQNYVKVCKRMNEA